MANKLSRAATSSPQSSAALDLDRRAFTQPAVAPVIAAEPEPVDDVDDGDELVDDPALDSADDFEFTEPEPDGADHLQAPMTPATAPVPTGDLHSIATHAAEQALRNLHSAPVFDVHDNRLTLTLPGGLLNTLRSQWATFNAARPDKLAFSTYLAARLQACHLHVDPRGVYLSGDNLQRVQAAAAGDFQTPTELADWITTTRQLSLVSVDGRSCLLQPIEVEVWDRLEFRLSDGESLSERVSEIVLRALLDEAGLS